MNRALRHVRQNVVAYLALFVALGGTSYAAITIPRNSVGANQIRNHSIDPVKLNKASVGGFVRLWARVDADGKLIASSPAAHVISWYPPGSQFLGGQVRWSARVRKDCFALATTESLPGPSPVSATAADFGRSGETVAISLGSADPVNVAVVCPQP